MIESIGIEELAPQDAAAVSARCSPDQIGPFVGEAFGEVMAALGRQGLAPAGPPFVRYAMGGDDGMDAGGQAAEFGVTAGFPCTAPVAAEGRVVPVTLRGGSAVVALHVGPWTGLGEAYAAVAAWMEEQGLTADGDPWETYLDGPEVVEHRTVLHSPCRPA